MMIGRYGPIRACHVAQPEGSTCHPSDSQGGLGSKKIKKLGRQSIIDIVLRQGISTNKFPMTIEFSIISTLINFQ